MRYTSKEKPQECPKCDSSRMVNIVYGLPCPEIFKEVEDGNVAIGGCCITGDDPSWKCLECGLKISNDD